MSTADALRHRARRLRVLGNGVVPAQAAAAFRILLARALDPVSQEE